MPIETIDLPRRTRESTIVITNDALAEVANGLDTIAEHKAIIVAREVDGKPFDTEAKARNYARTFANEFQEAYGEPAENGNEPQRLLSTHAVPGDLYKSGPNAGKPKNWLAAVSRNKRRPTVKRPDDAPTMRQLVEQVREWRKAYPDDKSFRNYTKWDYHRLRETVNAVTGYEDVEDSIESPDNNGDNENNENNENNE